MSQAVSRAQLIQQAQNRFNFNVAKWNIAIVGQTKSGKSSLVNSLRGLQETDSGRLHTCISNLPSKHLQQLNVHSYKLRRPFPCMTVTSDDSLAWYFSVNSTLLMSFDSADVIGDAAAYVLH